MDKIIPCNYIPAEYPIIVHRTPFFIRQLHKSYLFKKFAKRFMGI